MRNRKITFTNIGVIKGSRVWLNRETGVEIIKGKNFKEVGLYYVCIPTQGPDGRRVVGHQITLVMARSMAIGYVMYMRDRIAGAYTLAHQEDECRQVREENQMDQIDTWWRRHGIHGSTDYAASILAARELDHQEALDEHSSRYWAGATSGLPRVPAFS